MHRKPRLSSFLFRIQSKGQIVVEYILLLMISVSIALVLTSMVVSRNPSDPGFLIKEWERLIKWIGEDYPDEL